MRKVPIPAVVVAAVAAVGFAGFLSVTGAGALVTDDVKGTPQPEVAGQSIQIDPAFTIPQLTGVNTPSTPPQVASPDSPAVAPSPLQSASFETESGVPIPQPVSPPGPVGEPVQEPTPLESAPLDVDSTQIPPAIGESPTSAASDSDQSLTPGTATAPTALTGRVITPSPGSVVLETGEFGYLERRPAPKPYEWIGPADLDEKQRAAQQRWAEDPTVLVWRYDVHPNESNNWAGWGPPPPGWTTRPASGELSADGLPWPPPGVPRT